MSKKSTHAPITSNVKNQSEALAKIVAEFAGMSEFIEGVLDRACHIVTTDFRDKAMEATKRNGVYWKGTFYRGWRVERLGVGDFAIYNTAQTPSRHPYWRMILYGYQPGTIQNYDKMLRWVMDKVKNDSNGKPVHPPPSWAYHHITRRTIKKKQREGQKPLSPTLTSDIESLPGRAKRQLTAEVQKLLRAEFIRIAEQQKAQGRKFRKGTVEAKKMDAIPKLIALSPKKMKELGLKV